MRNKKILTFDCAHKVSATHNNSLLRWICLLQGVPGTWRTLYSCFSELLRGPDLKVNQPLAQIFIISTQLEEWRKVTNSCPQQLKLCRIKAQSDTVPMATAIANKREREAHTPTSTPEKKKKNAHGKSQQNVRLGKIWTLTLYWMP